MHGATFLPKVPTYQQEGPVRFHTSKAELTSKTARNSNKHPKKPRLHPSRHFPQRPTGQKATQAWRKPLCAPCELKG